MKRKEGRQTAAINFETREVRLFDVGLGSTWTCLLSHASHLKATSWGRRFVIITRRVATAGLLVADGRIGIGAISPTTTLVLLVKVLATHLPHIQPQS